MSVSSVKSAVKGRETEVLSSLGITPNKDNNQHITCPYPSHGGENDWRWDTKKSRAYCSCASSGHSIFDVVMGVNGCSFSESVVFVADVLGIDQEEKKRWPSAKAKNLLCPPANAQASDLPRSYLEYRLGAEPVMPSSKAVGWLQFPYFEAGPKHVGDWPCVAFETVSGDGRQHAHRIYVAPGGAGKADLGKGRDPKKSATKLSPEDNVSGCSVTWGDPAASSVIIVCEGIETGAAIALAAKESLDHGRVAIAAAISTSGISGFVPWPANKLVIVAADRDEDKPKDKRASGSLIMMTVDAPFLQAELCKVANFRRWSGKLEDWVATDPPIGDIRALMSGAGQWPTIPSITGITEIPVISNDGRVIDTPGHDEATGIFFDPGNTKFPMVPSNPTREDALAAAQVIENVISGFPFVDGIARSVAIAQIMTPFKRPFLRSAPMFLNTAPKMGSGKTLMASVVSYVATGKPPASMSQEENRDEEKKRMLALLMAGSAVTVIDNIERPLKSDTLCTVLTEPVWKERLLGKSEEIQVGTATTWIATGNNLEVSGDLSTRSLVCTIDPDCERPEEREFKVNLHEYVPAHRGEIAAACLTILKAYWLAKQRGERVDGITAFGRFEQWSDWIREPLVWLGFPDPCQARKLVESRDSAREELGALLEAWHEMFGDSPQTIKAAILAVSDATTEREIALKDAMLALSADLRENVNTRKLGKYISRHENRIESGFKFVRNGVAQGTVKWSVLITIDKYRALQGANIDNKTHPSQLSDNTNGLENKKVIGTFTPLPRVRNNVNPNKSKIVDSDSIQTVKTKGPITPKPTRPDSEALF